MRIQLLHVPCSLVDQLRARVQECLMQAGVSVPVEETEGLYTSRTLLVDGSTLPPTRPSPVQACCRLDLPTHTQILATLYGDAP